MEGEDHDFANTSQNGSDDSLLLLLTTTSMPMQMEEATSNIKNESDTKISQESFKNFISCSYRIFSRILHPTLASFYCVAREVLSLDETISSRLAITPTNEIVSVYATHVLVFAADRLDDPTYPTAVLRGMVLLCLLTLSQTITSLFSNTGSCLMVFIGALVLYPQVKKVPYLKCFWVPLAFAGASSAAAGAFSPMTTSSLEFFVCAFLYFLGNCSACDIADIQEDKEKGIHTIATKLCRHCIRHQPSMDVWYHHRCFHLVYYWGPTESRTWIYWIGCHCWQELLRKDEKLHTHQDRNNLKNNRMGMSVYL